MRKLVPILLVLSVLVLGIAGCNLSSNVDPMSTSISDGDEDVSTMGSSTNMSLILLNWARSEIVITNNLTIFTNMLPKTNFIDQIKTNKIDVIYETNYIKLTTNFIDQIKTNKIGVIYETNYIKLTTNFVDQFKTNKITVIYETNYYNLSTNFVSQVLTNIAVVSNFALYGQVQSESNVNKNQYVTIFYSMDSNNWKNLTVMRDSLTDDKLFAQYYFCTPLELLNSQPKDRPIIYIKVGYYKNNVTNYSESGKIYQSCPNPDPTLPSGVVGQGVIPGKHFMTECAEVTPVSNNGVLSGWKLHGHIQVKNESPGILKTINLIYRTNTMDWVRGAQERTYPILYATRTTNLFYGNGYKGGVENWEFTTIFPPSVFSIQFIGWDKVVTNYAAWADRNRCRKYHVNPFPGVVLTYQTND